MIDEVDRICAHLIQLGGQWPCAAAKLIREQQQRIKALSNEPLTVAEEAAETMRRIGFRGGTDWRVNSSQQLVISDELTQAMFVETALDEIAKIQADREAPVV